MRFRKEYVFSKTTFMMLSLSELLESYPADEKKVRLFLPVLEQSDF